MYYFIKLGRLVNHCERMDPIDFGAQRSKVKVTIDIYGNNVVNTIGTKPLCAFEYDRDYTIACFFVKLGRHVNHGKRMNPLNFGGHRSKVKVTMDIYGNNLVNTIATTPLCAS